MNLNELRDRAYNNACAHGFHDTELSNEHFLCLVISEMMEAVQADRADVRADKKLFERMSTEFRPHTKKGKEDSFKTDYLAYIKDSVEDELSDAVIRLLDLAGLRNITVFVKEFYANIASESCEDETFTESIYSIVNVMMSTGGTFDYRINDGLVNIFGLAKHLDIDLLWFIEQKMKYNELREKMHGKKY